MSRKLRNRNNDPKAPPPSYKNPETSFISDEELRSRMTMFMSDTAVIPPASRPSADTMRGLLIGLIDQELSRDPPTVVSLNSEEYDAVCDFLGRTSIPNNIQTTGPVTCALVRLYVNHIVDDYRFRRNLTRPVLASGDDTTSLLRSLMVDVGSRISPRASLTDVDARIRQIGFTSRRPEPRGSEMQALANLHIWRVVVSRPRLIVGIAVARTRAEALRLVAMRYAEEHPEDLLDFSSSDCTVTSAEISEGISSVYIRG